MKPLPDYSAIINQITAIFDGEDLDDNTRASIVLTWLGILLLQSQGSKDEAIKAVDRILPAMRGIITRLAVTKGNEE